MVTAEPDAAGARPPWQITGLRGLLFVNAGLNFAYGAVLAGALWLTVSAARDLAGGVGVNWNLGGLLLFAAMIVAVWGSAMLAIVLGVAVARRPPRSGRTVGFGIAFALIETGLVVVALAEGTQRVPAGIAALLLAMEAALALHPQSRRWIKGA